MKKYKRLGAAVLAAILVMVLAPTVALAAYDFNESYYLQQKLAQMKAEGMLNGDVEYTEATAKALLIQQYGSVQNHYEQQGRKEGLNPSPYFNEYEYLQAKANQMNSLKLDGRTNWTAEDAAKSIAAVGLLPVEHYEQIGAFEKDADGSFVNPSNAFDANAYWSAKLLQLQTAEPDAGWTLKKLLDSFQAISFSPVSHYIKAGEREAKASGIPFVQTVPMGQRVPNDPEREKWSDVVPGNYNPATPPPTDGNAQAPAKPYDAGGLQGNLPNGNLMRAYDGQAKNAPVPGDDGYIAPPDGLRDTVDRPLMPPASSNTGTLNDYWIKVNPNDGSGIVYDNNGNNVLTLPADIITITDDGLVIIPDTLLSKFYSDDTPGNNEPPEINEPPGNNEPVHPQSLAGRYGGLLGGEISDTQVTGAFHVGIKEDALGELSINAISLYVSEKGWQGDARCALSVYGESNAAIGANGTFTFQAKVDSIPRLDATGIAEDAFVTVSGSTDGSAYNIKLSALIDGKSITSNISGSGSKVSDTTPILADLPVPPIILQPGAEAILPAAWTQGHQYSGAISVPEGGTVALAEGEALPTGLVLNADGTVAGTPTEVGEFTFEITTRVGGVDTSTSYTITINPALTLTYAPDSAEVQVGQEMMPCVATVAEGTGTGARTFFMTGAPDGVTIDSATGEISGIPTEAGTITPENPAGIGFFTATVTVTDEVGATTDAQVEFFVMPAADPEIVPGALEAEAAAGEALAKEEIEIAQDTPEAAIADVEQEEAVLGSASQTADEQNDQDGGDFPAQTGENALLPGEVKVREEEASAA
ncbi:Ig domain-containing protein [Christensenellaceae bacterium OttesenSCG-928-K19]|nr:Ig domain-containing protein [Christensenellaceae bacterium OttesenSCG-928-K19]